VSTPPPAEPSGRLPFPRSRSTELKEKKRAEIIAEDQRRRGSNKKAEGRAEIIGRHASKY
jgi:hypothetical protein